MCAASPMEGASSQTCSYRLFPAIRPPDTDDELHLEAVRLGGVAAKAGGEHPKTPIIDGVWHVHLEEFVHRCQCSFPSALDSGIRTAWGYGIDSTGDRALSSPGG